MFRLNLSKPNQLKRKLTVFGCIALATGCANQTPQPALILKPSDDSLATLNAAASSLLNGRKVQLAQSAFTSGSKVSVVSALNNTPTGRLASGRTIVPPDELRLMRVGRGCELMHVASKQRAPLSGVSCVLEPRKK